jgi:hypothetical protein
MKPPPLGDGWYESEEPTRIGFVRELQRIRRRVRVRPIRIFLLTALITGVIGYKIATKEKFVEAEVVLALTEGALSADQASIPASELKEHVSEVLLPDNKLIEIVERYDLFRLRHRLGDQYAVGELRLQMEIDVWKNSFAYWDVEIQRVEKSARIGITFLDTDPDRAYAVALDLGRTAIASHSARQHAFAVRLADQAESMRASTAERLTRIENELAEKQAALDAAKRRADSGSSAALTVAIATLNFEAKQTREALAKITASREGLANEASAAGLFTTLAIVDQRRPERPAHVKFVLALTLVVVGLGAFLVAALVVGAFDTRIHDTDDVERLGLPVLGHVPGFAGDHVGSLNARGVARRRVPSFLRWRSRR